MSRAARPLSFSMMRSILLALALIAVGCAADDPLEGPDAEVGVEETSPTAAEDLPATEPAVPLPAAEPDSLDTQPLAEAIRPLPPADGIPAIGPAEPKPIGLRIDALGIESAAVRTVGVEDSGEMEVPAPTEVGWYGFGPSPGESGSAVLAAHIAADGVDGVFRYLTDLDPGDRVEVVFDDGSTEAFEIVELRQYDKDELPLDDLFARDGDARLALVTCGGDFNPSLLSYEDNVVAYAEPV